MDDRGFIYVTLADRDEVRRWQVGDKYGRWWAWYG